MAQDRTDNYVVHLFYHMKRNKLSEDMQIQVIKVLLFLSLHIRALCIYIHITSTDFQPLLVENKLHS